MSFCNFSDNRGNTYTLSSGHGLQTPSLTEYLAAVEVLGIIDENALFSAEQEIFHFHNFELFERLEQRLGLGWEYRQETVLASQIYPVNLPGRWPLILDAIYHGDIRFTQTGTATPQAAPPEVVDNRSILRSKIRIALATIVAQEKVESSGHTQRLREESKLSRSAIYSGAFLTGLWNAGADFAQWLKDVNDVVNPVQRNLRGIQSGYRALQRNSDNGEDLLEAFRDEVLTAEKRELVQVLGFDPSTLSKEQFYRATELADLIWEDPALQSDIRRFVKDYVKAQHAIEFTEFSGAAAFEVLFTILLAALTAGAGLAASAASQVKHFAKFRKVGELLLEFGEQAKVIRQRLKRNSAAGNSDGNRSFNDFESAGDAVLAPPRSAEGLATNKAKPKPKKTTDFSKRKGIPPASLEDATNRLNSMSEEISKNGYQAKYTDAELIELVNFGDVSKERYQVRFMESGYLTYNGEPGMLGAPMRGVSGAGAKYWSTSFDQLEDADTDGRLIAQKLGLKYNPKENYTLIVIDTEKAAPLTGVKSVPATFEKVSEFANRELPDKFPKEFTDVAMTPEFQEQYARHFQAAIDEKFLEDANSFEIEEFENYLNGTDLSEVSKSFLKKRMKMHKSIGNNQYYEGNGLTRELTNPSTNEYGAVETLNFERTPTNLRQLEDAGAISYVFKEL